MSKNLPEKKDKSESADEPFPTISLEEFIDKYLSKEEKQELEQQSTSKEE